MFVDTRHSKDYFDILTKLPPQKFRNSSVLYMEGHVKYIRKLAKYCKNHYILFTRTCLWWVIHIDIVNIGYILIISLVNHTNSYIFVA